jgi:hypothetical protein
MKRLALLPLAACLFAPAAFAAHPEKAPEKPAQTLNVESLDDLEFSDREIRIIRQQIKAAQKRADRAHLKDVPAKSISESLKDIKLPTEAEIEEMQAQLPDLNAMLAGMMKLATDEDMKKGMAKSADRLREKFEDQDFETEDGMPDLNAMMSTMLSLMGDEELVGGMIEAIEPIAELMEDMAPESAKPE